MYTDGKHNGTHLFEFEIKQQKNDWMTIGIDAGTRHIQTKFYKSDSKYHHYALRSDGKFFRKDAKEQETTLAFIVGDIVKMRVNLGPNTIEFAVNDDVFEEVSKIENISTPYYMALGIYWHDCQVSLRNYSFLDLKEEDESKITDDKV